MSRAAPITIGQRFGRLVAVRRGPNSHRRVTWHFRCDCGEETIARSDHVRAGLTKSCGCLKRESGFFGTHGMKGTRIYRIWCSMWQRCTNPNEPSFKNYGGRGITVAPEWWEFERFLADMGEPPSSGHSIDRIDNNAGYCKANCRWATPIVQANNRRNVRILEAFGERRSIAQWARAFGLRRTTLHMRLSRGASLEEALGGAGSLFSHGP